MDWLVILAVAFTLTAHAATVYIEAKASGITGIASTGTSLEANSNQRFIQGLNYLSQFVLDGLLYGALLGTYIWLKGRTLGKSAEGEIIMWVFVASLFMLSAIDVTNDLAYVAAIGI